MVLGKITKNFLSVLHRIFHDTLHVVANHEFLAVEQSDHGVWSCFDGFDHLAIQYKVRAIDPGELNHSFNSVTYIQTMSQIRGTSIHSDLTAHSGKNTALHGAAWTLDLCLGLSATLAGHAVRSELPAWGVLPLLATGLLSLGIALLGRVLLGQTVGEWVFDLLPARRFGLRLLARATPLTRQVTAGAALAGLVFANGLWVTERVLEHPILRTAREITVDPFLPAQSAQWTIAPFYFALVATPHSYQGSPVFYGLGYQKGPPAVFVDHFTARWDYPDIQWVVEGPKTPRATASDNAAGTERSQLRECLLTWGGLNSQCQDLRQDVLARHVREMRAQTHARFGGDRWALRWFQISNPALHPDDVPQGFYLQARGPVFQEERYVFVSARGRHQAFALRAPAGAVGAPARELFHQIAASTRMNDDLAMGKLWSDQQLRQVRTSQIQKMEQWSAVFALLLGRVSVDPRDRQAYYHLGGMAHAALKMAVRGYPAWVKGLAEMLQACERYLADLAPESVEHRSLRLLAVDADKALKGERF